MNETNRKPVFLKRVSKFLTWFIASVWLINGLFCKILNFVPRHEAIVSAILSDEYSRFLTMLIGGAEIIMAVWILSGFRSRLNAIIQIVIIASMNLIEFKMVPDLLLWRKANILFALLFILIIFYNEFVLKRKITQQT